MSLKKTKTSPLTLKWLGCLSFPLAHLLWGIYFIPVPASFTGCVPVSQSDTMTSCNFGDTDMDWRFIFIVFFNSINPHTPKLARLVSLYLEVTLHVVLAQISVNGGLQKLQLLFFSVLTCVAIHKKAPYGHFNEVKTACSMEQDFKNTTQTGLSEPVSRMYSKHLCLSSWSQIKSLCPEL